MFSAEELARATALSCKNGEKEETEIGFDYKGQWITNPFFDETGRFQIKTLNDMYGLYGKENVDSFIIEILREEKYPVSKQKCSSCGMCSLVTQTIIGVPLKETEQYYQCIAMAEDVCGEDVK